MKILLVILLCLAAILVLVLLIALFIRREHYSRTEVLIEVPSDKVFAFVRMLKNQEKFNKWAAQGQREEYERGIDGTEGFLLGWKGDKSAGEGEKEIKKIVEGRRIESDMRFIKPMVARATLIMETEPVSARQTKVTWSNRSALQYPLNIMVPMMERMMKREMGKSLQNLKQLLEAEG